MSMLKSGSLLRALQMQTPTLARAFSPRTKNAVPHCYFSPHNLTIHSSSASSGTPLPIDQKLKSAAGKIYHIEELLVDRRDPLLCVYRARAEGERYIVKNMIPGEFKYQLDLQKSLSSCSNVRVLSDTIPELELFVYPFMTGDLLRLSQRNISQEVRKSILRSALEGLADLHGRDILHNDIKPNNILLNYDEDIGGQIIIKDVKISDLEDTVIVPSGKWLRGPLCGNAMWRSPESWCRARQNQASDMFSFAIVMIYVMVNDMIFRVKDDQMKAEDSWRYILRRHISYFADEDGLNGFLQHIGDENPFFQRMIDLVDSFVPGDLREPFLTWHYVDPVLRDLVGKMTNLDPRERITAQEALGHPWFVNSG